MIRDPSDGTVYEPPKVEKAPAIIAEPTSGLPTGSQKEKNLQRLEKSREWLKEYFAKRGQQ